MPEGLSVNDVLPKTVCSGFSHIARTDFPVAFTRRLPGDDLEIISVPIDHDDVVARRYSFSNQARPTVKSAPWMSVSYWFEKLSLVA